MARCRRPPDHPIDIQISRKRHAARRPVHRAGVRRRSHRRVSARAAALHAGGDLRDDGGGAGRVAGGATREGSGAAYASRARRHAGLDGDAGVARPGVGDRRLRSPGAGVRDRLDRRGARLLSPGRGVLAGGGLLLRGAGRAARDDHLRRGDGCRHPPGVAGPCATDYVCRAARAARDADVRRAAGRGGRPQRRDIRRLAVDRSRAADRGRAGWLADRPLDWYARRADGRPDARECCATRRRHHGGEAPPEKRSS